MFGRCCWQLIRITAKLIQPNLACYRKTQKEKYIIVRLLRAGGWLAGKDLGHQEYHRIFA